MKKNNDENNNSSRLLILENTSNGRVVKKFEPISLRKYKKTLRKRGWKTKQNKTKQNKVVKRGKLLKKSEEMLEMQFEFKNKFE